MALIDLQAHIRDPNAHHVPGAGGWQVLAEVEVSSDCDYVDFTGLDINKDWEYYLDVTLKNPSEETSVYYIFVEGDYTLGNYYTQYVTVSGTSTSPVRSNTPTIISIPTGERTFFNVRLTRDPDGYFRWLSVINYRTGSDQRLNIRAGSKTAPVSNITSLRISASVSGGIGAGSRFILARPRS